jgi:uncharacterized LabA/DUF88 family protein
VRTRVYIDGFNRYYGCLRGTPAKWLNPALLCDNLLPRNRIEAVRYFTATVSSRPNDPDQATRQQTYFPALATEPRVSIHLGHFLTHEVDMPEAAAWRQGHYKRCRVVKTEEKGSDVNLSTMLLIDAFDDQFDCAVLISNDSDLKEPLSIVRNRFGKTIGILNPQARVSRALLPIAHFVKPIRYSALNRAQFPDQLTDATGTFTKPARW